MRVLVTGITGFAGPVVATELMARGHEVHGLVRGAEVPARLRAVGMASTALHRTDLREPAAVARVVAELLPDGLIHLAGFSSVPAAEQNPVGAYAINLGGTLTVLAAVRAHVPRARVVSVSSSHIYGAAEPGEQPITEDAPLRPFSIYGASKAAADLAAGQWARAYGLHVVRARPFNHTGPGQDPAFVCAALARQLALIEAGRQEPVLVAGNVDPVRDFSDVRDIAAGYVALLERGHGGAAYNLCSGEGVSVAEVVALLRTHARVPVRVRSDPERRRDHDVPRIVGNAARAAADTGWRPRVPLADTLATVLEDWRGRIADGS
jgi:GDP-4-dehydro-6-deoxy-D-mannose reductase